MSAIYFDQTAKELRFDPTHFRAKPIDPFVSWEPGLRRGTPIRVNMKLCTIYWDDGVIEEIKSPIAGVVVKTNRRIVHPRLRFAPAQLVLIVE